MTISFSGTFTVYSINSNHPIQKLFSQSLNISLPNGVYCAEIDTQSKYLIIGSFASSASNGLSIWRIVNNEPGITIFETTMISDQDNTDKV